MVILPPDSIRLLTNQWKEKEDIIIYRVTEKEIEDAPSKQYIWRSKGKEAYEKEKIGLT